MLGGSEGELKIHGSGSPVIGLDRSRAAHVVAAWPSLVASPIEGRGTERRGGGHAKGSGTS